jgi:hypothetical protein
MKRFAIAYGVDVLGGIIQEIKRRAGCGGFGSGAFGKVPFFWHKDNHPDATLSSNRQRLIQPQLVLSIHNPGGFNRVHDQDNVADFGQKTSSFSPLKKNALNRTPRLHPQQSEGWFTPFAYLN